jgi:hypothetical protein
VRNDPDVDAHPEATARECIVRGIRSALAARDAEVLRICEEEEQAYLASAKKLDAAGRHASATGEVNASLACRRIAERVRALLSAGNVTAQEKK